LGINRAAWANEAKTVKTELKMRVNATKVSCKKITDVAKEFNPHCSPLCHKFPVINHIQFFKIRFVYRANASKFNKF
jgi:hypothetical protein